MLKPLASRMQVVLLSNRAPPYTIRLQNCDIDKETHFQELYYTGGFPVAMETTWRLMACYYTTTPISKIRNFSCVHNDTPDLLLEQITLLFILLQLFLPLCNVLCALLKCSC